MTAQQAFVAARRIHDYWPVPPQGHQSVVTYPGGVPQASSSGDSAFADRNRANGWGAAMAFDHDPTTQWRSTAPTSVGQWVGLTGMPAQSLHRVSVSMATDPGLAVVTELSVRVGGRNIAEASDVSIRAAAEWFETVLPTLTLWDTGCWVNAGTASEPWATSNMTVYSSEPDRVALGPSQALIRIE